MRGVQISYLIEHPEYIPQLAQWLFEQWDSILGEGTPEARITKLKTHLNRDKLPIAWVAHANGQLLGTAALRVHACSTTPCIRCRSSRLPSGQALVITLDTNNEP